MARLLFIQAIVIMLVGFSLFPHELRSFFLLLLGVCLMVILLSFRYLPLRYSDDVENIGSKRKNANLISLILKRKISAFYFCFVIVLSVSFLYLLSINFPGLHSDSAVLKLRVNSNPVLARFLRVIIPVFIIVYTSHFRKLPSYPMLGFVFFIMLATGFKGYVISFFFIPLLFAIYLLGRLNFVSIFFLGLLAFLLLMTSVSIATGLNGLDVFRYIVARASYSQSESIGVIYSNLDKYSGFGVFAASFLSTLNRFGVDATNLNEILFTDLHGENPFHMQLAVPSLLEIYLSLGTFPTLFFALIFCFFVIFLEKKIRMYFAYRRYYLLGVYYIILSGFLDFFSNGNIGSKLLDIGFSSFFYIFVLYSLRLRFLRYGT